MNNQINAEVSAEDLELINRYTKREFSADEIYTFSVVLCDNEIDRDYECFDSNALDTLAKMYVGKSGILDHAPRAENQTARIYRCETETVPNRQTSYGVPYKRIKAKAYMPRSEKNSELILALDSGINKEVSVGCSMGKNTCSICGMDIRGCSHIKGRKYGDLLCYAVLSEPKDAYEWSFVAVPAQREAGVLKAFNGFMKGEKAMEDVFKRLNSNEDVTLTNCEVKELLYEIDCLKAKARDGELYREETESEMIRLCSIVEPELSIETIKSVASRMTIEELKAFKKIYQKRASATAASTPQLVITKNTDKENIGNSAYSGI